MVENMPVVPTRRAAWTMVPRPSPPMIISPTHRVAIDRAVPCAVRVDRRKRHGQARARACLARTRRRGGQHR